MGEIGKIWEGDVEFISKAVDYYENLVEQLEERENEKKEK